MNTALLPALFALTCFLTLAACGTASKNYSDLPTAKERENTWQKWRFERDSLFKTEDSPLHEDDVADFIELHYFPFDSTLAWPLALEPVLRPDTMSIPTTTGQVQRYVRYGRFAFHLHGRMQQLTVYRSVDTESDDLFIPFTDPTNRSLTYGGGRYINLKPEESGRYVLDFNYAYHPYCAYDSRWSCPIPPPENRLSQPVEAGERLEFPL